MDLSLPLQENMPSVPEYSPVVVNEPGCRAVRAIGAACLHMYQPHCATHAPPQIMLAEFLAQSFALSGTAVNQRRAVS